MRQRNILEARSNRENLVKSREAAAMRLEHYAGLLSATPPTIPVPPTISSTLDENSQLPADTVVAPATVGVDDSLVDSGESGVKVIPKEKEEMDKSLAAKWVTLGASAADTLAGVFSLFPQLDAEGTPLGVGAGAWWGGQNLGAGTSALAKAANGAAAFLNSEAAQAARVAGFIRREQDWTLQANIAGKEIIQLDKQITSADIRIQVAETELANHRQSIQNSKDVEQFLKDKFTNQELYHWMKDQLFSTYKQSFNLAFDMEKKAEKAYRFEMGTNTANFIQYGYWDNSMQDLVAAEKLQLALRQLEKSYLEENRRELELVKNVSLARLDPLALIQLRETGNCYVFLPEELFDMDFQGHYFRRIKAVKLSVPCVAGPATTVSCTLRLLSNSIRLNTSMNSSGAYEHENDNGVPTDDNRFQTNLVPVAAIATSTAQNDPGMFEFNFRDERYLPFERAGAISQWKIELANDRNFRLFDYSTIAEVMIQVSYTAREGGLKAAAADYLNRFLKNTADFDDQPLAQMFSMRHEYPSEWYRFLHPAAAGGEQS